MRTDIDWDAERAAFEHWFLHTQCKKNYQRVTRDGAGVYMDRVVALAWRAWKHALVRPRA